MQPFRRILLEVWREACRHIEIDESTLAIVRLLATQMPLGRILVRRIDAEPASIVTVAAAPPEPHSPIAEHRRSFSAEEFHRLLGWTRSGRILRRGKRLTGALGLVLPPDVGGDLLVVPLGGAGGPKGVLLLVAQGDREFEDSHLEMLESLREPFSVALENDQRLHEMARLREAAEAERGALLRRLGRTDLGETIVGEQTGLRQVMERVELVAHSDVPVLILGETGTGKELVARALHVRGSRHQGPFIRVNCGAIPSELIDSQLFGHEKGSFTGAEQSRQGWFERADGGTLFLDEIGELPLEAQVRFLRVLQDGFVERVGSAHPIHVDVRVVAATHRDLAMMVRERRFREDLWYRLAVFPLLLPPLRERTEDIRELANHFAERAAARFSLSPAHPDEEDIRLLQSYDWPGNIRELGAVIDRAAILGNGKGLEVAKALGSMNSREVRTPPSSTASSPGVNASPHGEVLSLDEAMRAHIETVLKLTEGRIEGRRGAAALLRINPHTLRARMRKLGVDWSSFRR
ncbi:MAG: sigma 54-interacting transcriptional regulator [Pirellulaceae bacterium]|nr:sigma 54-interacting transcriptional regulator [Pirellulaceae bacterium]